MFATINVNKTELTVIFMEFKIDIDRVFQQMSDPFLFLKANLFESLRIFYAQFFATSKKVINKQDFPFFFRTCSTKKPQKMSV